MYMHIYIYFTTVTCCSCLYIITIIIIVYNTNFRLCTITLNNIIIMILQKINDDKIKSFFTVIEYTEENFHNYNIIIYNNNNNLY